MPKSLGGSIKPAKRKREPIGKARAEKAVPPVTAEPLEPNTVLLRKIIGKKCWPKTELLRELADACGFKRLTDKRQQQLNKLLQQATRAGWLEQQGRGENAELNLSFTKLQDANRDTLDALLKTSMRKNKPLERDQVYRDLLNHCGYARSTATYREAFDKHLRSALRRKVVVKVGEEIKRIN